MRICARHRAPSRGMQPRLRPPAAARPRSISSDPALRSEARCAAGGGNRTVAEGTAERRKIYGDRLFRQLPQRRIFCCPGEAVNLTFLVHPSRAPVGQNDVVSGVALPFDEFRQSGSHASHRGFPIDREGRNTRIASGLRRKMESHGFAPVRANRPGRCKCRASINDVSARRVVQQVASDPCSLRIKGQRTAKGIVVETEPVRDCTGNPVPDGTVVTFTAKDWQRNEHGGCADQARRRPRADDGKRLGRDLRGVWSGDGQRVAPGCAVIERTLMSEQNSIRPTCQADRIHRA